MANSLLEPAEPKRIEPARLTPVKVLPGHGEIAGRLAVAMDALKASSHIMVERLEAPQLPELSSTQRNRPSCFAPQRTSWNMTAPGRHLGLEDAFHQLQVNDPAS